MTARKPQTHNLWSILLLFVMIFSSNTAGATESFEPQPREPWQLDSIADYLHLRGGVADVGFGLGREDERWLSGGNMYEWLHNEVGSIWYRHGITDRLNFQLVSLSLTYLFYDHESYRAFVTVGIPYGIIEPSISIDESRYYMRNELEAQWLIDTRDAVSLSVFANLRWGAGEPTRWERLVSGLYWHRRWTDRLTTSLGISWQLEYQSIWSRSGYVLFGAGHRKTDSSKKFELYYPAYVLGGAGFSNCTRGRPLITYRLWHGLAVFGDASFQLGDELRYAGIKLRHRYTGGLRWVF